MENKHKSMHKCINCLQMSEAEKPGKHNLHVNKSGAPALCSPDANGFPPSLPSLPPPPALTHHWQHAGRWGFPSCPGQLAIIESVQVRGPACRDFIRKAADLTWPTFPFFQSATPGEPVTPELVFLTQSPSWLIYRHGRPARGGKSLGQF